MLQRTCVSQKEKRKGRGTLRNTEVHPSKICYLAINYQASLSFGQKIAHPVPEGILGIHFWYSFQNNTKINRNRQENENLPPEVLIAICTSVAADEKKTDIARRFKIDFKPINRTIKRFSVCHDFKSRHHAGCLRFSNAHTERHSVRLARRVPNVSWQILLQQSGNCVWEYFQKSHLPASHPQVVLQSPSKTYTPTCCRKT